MIKALTPEDVDFKYPNVKLSIEKKNTRPSPMIKALTPEDVDFQIQMSISDYLMMVLEVI